MSHAELENLSALTDGELGPDQIRFLLRRVDGDDALRGAWSRYHLIGEGMRREVCVLADDGFVDKVMQQLDTDAGVAMGPNAVHGSVGQKRGHHWLRWSAGGAIAAGVAVAALVMVRPGMNPASVSAPDTQARVAAAQPATSVARPQPMAAPEVPRWLSASPSAAQLAQPAAANFYSGPMPAGEPRGYGQHLSPYMTLPGSRAAATREARQVMRQLWSMAPRHAAQRQPMLWSQTAH
ncbi:MAG TPA: sigma-E factor negative regulatory protein [Oleiagrimonas sp.]|nr:sigma-E factor negative regulatory protein [Oleiagrimonas sp.]